MKQEIKHQTTRSLSHTETLWYKNKKAKNPEKNVIHSQNVELMVQSSWKSMGGVKANIIKGMSARYTRYFFIRKRRGF
jgi:hypothetical protein